MEETLAYLPSWGGGSFQVEMAAFPPLWLGVNYGQIFPSPQESRKALMVGDISNLSGHPEPHECSNAHEGSGMRTVTKVRTYVAN